MVALEYHHKFAESKSIETERKFPDLVIELISRRPYVFAEAMDSFSELRSLVIRVVREEFCKQIDGSVVDPGQHRNDMVSLRIRAKVGADFKDTKLQFQLLKSIAVLLSTWKDEGNDCDVSASSIHELVDALLRAEDDDTTDQAQGFGLAGAVMAGTSVAAASAEMVGCLRSIGDCLFVC